MTELTSNIMKVGAHLDDTRALVDVWDLELSAEENIARVVDDNLLGLPSRSRAHDVMVRALRPRFVDAGADVLNALKPLARNQAAFRDACYYELTRVDALVTAFVTEQLTIWWDEGRLAITTTDAREWIDKLVADQRVPEWTDNIRDRVSRGMMAALRDLGRLEGKHHSSKKEIARPGITLAGFAYVCFRLHDQRVSSRSIRSSDVWRRWLLDQQRVDQLLEQLAASGVIYYSVAGSVMRIDWQVGDLSEVVRATA